MAKPSQHNKPWTKAEVTQLKKMYHKVIHREIASKLKRTLSAVESKAVELGLTRKKK